MSRDPDDERDEWNDARADDFRCHGCETPTFRGRLCAACRAEAGLDD